MTVKVPDHEPSNNGALFSIPVDVRYAYCIAVRAKHSINVFAFISNKDTESTVALLAFYGQ